MTLTVRNMEAGQGVEELEIDYDGPAFDIGFNARYLLDVCAQIEGDTAELRFADPFQPDPGARPRRRRRPVRADAAAGLRVRAA
jgi:DNA polymerase III sliding clamp (beta) subunit (PCNA family)